MSSRREGPYHEPAACRQNERIGHAAQEDERGHHPHMGRAISGTYMQTETAVPNVASGNQVLRRSLISTRGAQRNTRTPGRFATELTVCDAIRGNAGLGK